MDSHPHINRFKLKLQSAGALRPEAWERCVASILVVNIKEKKSYAVPSGSLAFVTEGLLKECDTQQRDCPSILSFLAAGQCFHAHGPANRIYTKAILPCSLIVLERAPLLSLIHDFEEMDQLYLNLCSEYDEQRLLKIVLLEKQIIRERVELFRTSFKKLSPFLKKKDMANYLHLSYNHFLTVWNAGL